MKTFTDQQISDWKRYEEVRKRGRWNMFSPQARAATGLSAERYSFCIGNYSKLKEAALVTSLDVVGTDGCKATTETIVKPKEK